MGAHSQQKGKRGELEVVRLLLPVFPECHRRPMGDETIRDQGRDIVGAPGLCIQCQLADRPTPEKKLAEAVRAAKVDELPVAFTRRTGGQWMVTIQATDFITWLEGTAEMVERLKEEGPPPLRPRPPEVPH